MIKLSIAKDLSLILWSAYKKEDSIYKTAKIPTANITKNAKNSESVLFFTAVM